MVRRAASLGRVARFVSLLRRGIASEGDADEVLAELQKVLGVRGVVLADGWDSAWHLTRGLPDAYVRDFARLSREDPSRRALLGAPAGTWWCLQRDITPRARASELYASFERNGLRDAAIARLYSPFRDDVALGLYSDDGPISRAQLGLLDVLYPHLAAACATRRALALMAGGPERDVPAVYVAFPRGAVHVDAAARAVVERYVGRVGAHAWSRVEEAIAALARAFAYGQACARSHVLWRGLRVDFAVVPARPGEAVRLAGFLVEESAGDAQAEAVVAHALAPALLTPRELAVARGVAAGMDVPSIAESLRIGPETARTHLRAVYRKLRVGHRVELAKVLARG